MQAPEPLMSVCCRGHCFHTKVLGDSPRALQACVAAVQAADTSAYNVHSPAIRGGPVPRLAREILVDTLSLVYQDLGGRGSVLSGELHGALALGFDGEIGNFILR